MYRMIWKWLSIWPRVVIEETHWRGNYEVSQGHNHISTTIWQNLPSCSHSLVEGIALSPLETINTLKYRNLKSFDMSALGTRMLFINHFIIIHGKE